MRPVRVLIASELATAFVSQETGPLATRARRSVAALALGGLAAGVGDGRRVGARERLGGACSAARCGAYRGEHA